MRPTAPGLAVLVTLVLLLGGCADADPGAGPSADSEPADTGGAVLSVEEALTADAEEAEVRGYVYVSRNGAARLCAGLAGSFPPQCGDPSLTVEGLDVDTLTGVETDQGVTWTGETTLRGSLSGGVLAV